MRRGCKQAQLVLAALGAGDVVADAERLQLTAHLERCASCRALARGMTEVKAILKAHEPGLEDADLDRLWSRVRLSLSDAPRRAGAPLASPARSRWPWQLGLGAALVAGAAALLLVVLHRRAADGPHSMPVVSSGAKPTPLPQSTSKAHAKVLIAPKQGRIGHHRARSQLRSSRPAVRVLAATKAHREGQTSSLVRGATVERGGALRVARGGLLVLRGAAEGAVLAGSTRVQLRDVDAVEGEATLLLSSGSITIASLPGAAPAVVGQAGRWTVRTRDVEVRPLGTIFSVSRFGSGPSVVRVTEGKVEVRCLANGASNVVGAGMQVAGCARARVHLEAKAQAKLEAQARLVRGASRQQLVHHQPAVLDASARAPHVPYHGPQRRVRRRAAPSSLLRPSSDLAALERALANGQTSRVLRRSRQLLADRTTSPQDAVLLRVLVAEAYTLEKRYAAAVRAYQVVLDRYARHALAAHALYMIGSLELDQIGDARSAAKHFAEYLRRYPAGPQREAAYLMLWRALVGAKDAGRALKVARQYLDEFPQGRYAKALRREAGPAQNR